MKKNAFTLAFALGALAVLWVAAAVATTNPLVLVMTLLVAAVYGYGAMELHRYRQRTAQLAQALEQTTDIVQDLHTWLQSIPDSLQNAVRQRVEGERVALPGPAFTPYLVGLLVMLGMLGTFLGMVVTLNGAVFALEDASSVQGMRAAFSEPIKGLGLAFGTSVAGVATSAMLGLMSSLARRERARAAHQLDRLMGQQLRTFSLTHQRQETYKALQQQSQALPLVVEQLSTLMARVEQHSQHLGDSLRTQQDSFHRDVKTSYTELAQSVDQSLRSSLSQSMQVASDSIRPVVQSTLADMTQQAQSQHERMVTSTREQLENLNQSFDTRSQDLITALRSTWSEQQTQQIQADQARLDGWKASLSEIASGLQAHSTQTVAEITRLLASSEALVQARMTTEAEAVIQHNQRAEELAKLLRTELSALREQEAQRGEAAVARLATLETTVTQHLSRLGTALEAPITRLIETASEAPKAAAEVIGQLRQEISVSVARDNALLEERTRILETLSTLLDAINHASTEQRGVIDALVASSQSTLTQTSSEFHSVLARSGENFQAYVTQESDKLGAVAAQVTASAVDVASLGETFAFAVRAFNDNSDKLASNLQRIEAAIAQSMQRSDEQLAYYVAQARELIDLSISSQKDVLEALQQRQSEGAA
ncbi:hypothetical protein [Limnohabitans sp.]|uniref:hypothetical protein n=1 Tax=Limnohabitans sp. TaxID=1907725 RepID=UPI00311FF5FB